MTIFNPCCFTPQQVRSLFFLTLHVPFQQQEAVPAAHATSASPFLTPPDFSFPHCPLSHLLCWAPSSAASPTAHSLRCSSGLLCPPPQHPRDGGHGHLQRTAKQRPAVCAVSSLLPHVTLLLSMLPHASPLSTEFCGIKILQSNQNSHGHQIRTEWEQIWLQRKIQCSYAKARMGTGFCRLAKFGVSVPLYLMHAPAQRLAPAFLTPSVPLWDAHPDWVPGLFLNICLLQLEAAMTLKTNSWNICNALLSCSNADTWKDVWATPDPWASLGFHYSQLKCLACIHIKTGTTYQ